MTKLTVVFGRPTIGPKVYITQGPSGWPEQIDRKKADAQLTAFLHPLDVDEQVAGFVMELSLKGETDTWGDVVTYLSEITEHAPSAIPEIVGVAFWARAILMQRTQGAN